MANTFVKIASVTVGSGGAADITFSSIPSTYTDLKIVYSTRCTADNVNTTFTLNGSTSNFSFRQIYGSGTTTASNSSASNVSSGPITNSSAYTASIFSNGEVYFPNYTSSNNKSFSIDGVTENNAALSYQHFIAGLWSNTAAITSIKLAPNSGNFAQYSTATLYGIKSS